MHARTRPDQLITCNCRNDDSCQLALGETTNSVVEGRDLKKKKKKRLR